jgi:RNA 2',3'-cyclic 3'-phosphodiesterase
VLFRSDVAAERIPQVCEWVAKAVASVEPFDLQIHGAGAFPNLARPRTIWLGTEAGQHELAAVAERLDAALEGLGFAPEGRAFRGHLTLGRVRRPTPALAGLSQLVQQHATFEAGVTPIGEVVVFSSHLARTGPTYEALARAKFQGRPQMRV